MSVCRPRFEIFCQRRDQIEDQRSRPSEAAYDKLMLSEGFIKLRKATFDDYVSKFEFSYRDTRERLLSLKGSAGIRQRCHRKTKRCWIKSRTPILCARKGVSQEWREVKGDLGGFCAVAASVLVKTRPQFPSIPLDSNRHH